MVTLSRDFLMVTEDDEIVVVDLRCLPDAIGGVAIVDELEHFSARMRMYELVCSIRE